GRALSGGSYSGTIVTRSGSSRPTDHQRQNTNARPPIATNVASPSHIGVRSKSCARPRGRSWRIGLGSGTTPLRSPATIVNCSPGPRTGTPEKTAPWDELLTEQVSCEPAGPAKHAVCVNAAGACTVALARWIGTGQSPPVTFQKSSSGSLKPFSAPRTT